MAGNAASHFPLLLSDLVACADPDICKKICGNPSGCSDIAYPKLVLELLPVGKSLVMVLALLGLARGSHRCLGGKFREENTLEPSFSGVCVGQIHQCHFKLELKPVLRVCSSPRAEDLEATLQCRQREFLTEGGSAPPCCQDSGA